MLEDGQKVEIYRNLNRRNGIWFSVRDRKSGLVVRRMNIKDFECLVLKNAEFKVSKAGRDRVLREKRKNVHALIKADVFRHPSGKTPLTFYDQGYYPVTVSYNPYANETFIANLMNGKVHIQAPIERADFVTIDDAGVRAWVRRGDLSGGKTV